MLQKLPLTNWGFSQSFMKIFHCKLDRIQNRPKFDMNFIQIQSSVMVLVKLTHKKYHQKKDLIDIRRHVTLNTILSV